MRDNKKIVTALDIGSSKIVAVVAEVYKDGSFRVLSQGRADSLGVRDGNVTNIEETQQQVKAALAEAVKYPARKCAPIFPANHWKDVTPARKCL